MLGFFLTKDPVIYDTIIGIIDQHRQMVAEYNKSVPLKDIAARLLRPDDQVIGQTAEVYASTYTTGSDEYLLSAAAPLRVPIGQGVLHLGWQCEGDLGSDGILEVDLEGVKRQEIRARWAYNSAFNLYIEPQQVVFAKENDKIAWIVRNAAGVDITCVVFPFAFIIAPRKQLLL
jgi:hypothetical protein